MDAQSYFSTKLVDMGELDSRLAGIWTPESQRHAVPVGLTEQFIEQAGDYAAKYASPAYFRALIVRGLALSGARLGRAPRILDIGTGAGCDFVTFPPTSRDTPIIGEPEMLENKFEGYFTFSSKCHRHFSGSLGEQY